MPELYANLLVVLIVFVIANFIRTRYATQRNGLVIQRVIYVLAIAYFIFMAVYYPIEANSVKRMIQILFPILMVGYLVYKLTTSAKKSS
jgi:Ca2+/Na+ antiporter